MSTPISSPHSSAAELEVGEPASLEVQALDPTATLESSEPAGAPPPRGRSQIIRNVLVNWAAWFVTLVTGFWMSPFLIRHLGESHYGTWILAGNVIGTLGLLDFGITQSTVKYIAEFRAKDDQESINRIVTGGLAVFSLVGVLTLVFSVVLGLGFKRFFPNTDLSNSTIALVVLLVGLNQAFIFPASVFLGVLRGFQRYDVGANAMSFSIVARSVLIVWALTHGYRIVAIAVLTLVFEMLRLGYVTARVWNINPQLRIGRRYFQQSDLNRLFGHSVWIFLIMVGDQLNYYTDSIVIGHFLSAVAITVYSIAFRLVSYLRQLVVEMVGVLMPTVSDLYARNDSGRVSEILVMGTKFTVLLSFPPAAVFFLLGDRFIELWMGKSYEQSAFLLSILTVGIVVHLCEMTVTTALVGMGRAQIVARFALIQSGLNFVLSLLLIKPYGLLGVALGTTISMTGCIFYSIPIFFRQFLKLPLGPFLSGAFVRPLLVQIPWVVALALIREWVPLHSVSGFFGVLLLALVPFAVLVFATCLNEREKAAFGNLTGRFGFKSKARVAKAS